MPKITRVNIAAARAQRDILVRRNLPVPDRIQRIAELDPDRLPQTSSSSATPYFSGVWSPKVEIPGLTYKLLPTDRPGAKRGPHSAAQLFYDVFDDETILRRQKMSYGPQPRIIVVDSDHLGAADEFIHGSHAPLFASQEREDEVGH